MKKRNVVLLIILAVLLVFAIAIGVVIYKNWNTVSALYYVFTNQSEAVELKKNDTDQRAQEAIQDYGIDSIRSLTEEEAEKLNSGELTEEEAIKIVLGQNEDSQNPETPQTDTEVGTTTEPPQSSKNKITDAELKAKNDEIAQLIGKMYVLKARFTNELKVIKEWVLDEYVRLPKKQRTTSLKAKIGKEAYAKASALEAECDAEVDAILDRLTVLLEETGQNTSIVSEIKEAYESEKIATKSYYLSKIDQV